MSKMPEAKHGKAGPDTVAGKCTEIENALQDQKDFTENLIQYSSVPTFVINSGHKVVYWNKACEELTGLELSRVAGTGNHYKPFYKDKRPTLADIVIDKSFEQLALHYAHYEVSPTIKNGLHAEGWYENLNGKKRYITFDAAPILDKQGKIIAAIETLQDITHRKKAIEDIQYRVAIEKLVAKISTDFINLAAENLDAGINRVLKDIGEFARVDRSYVFLFSEDGIVINNTHEWCRQGIDAQIKYLQGVDLNDMPWFSEKIKKLQVIHIPRVSDLPIDAINERSHFESQNIQSLIVVPMIYREALIGFLGFDSVLSKKQWTEEDIALLKMVGEIFVNTLERNRAEVEKEKLIFELKIAFAKMEVLNQELKLRAEKLEAAYQDMESFSYSASHDLRAPLMIIDGFSRILLKKQGDKLDDDGKEMLSVVRSSAEKMTRLINDLLSFARISAKAVLKSDIDMRALVQNIFDDMHSTIAGRNVQLDIKDLPVAWGDPPMIRQVWVNLLSNAVKFTRPRKKAKIEIGGAEEGEEIVYYIKDNGIGFDSENGKRLFGFFERLQHKEKFEGTGIGLVIVKRIIEKHGGRVWAEGKPDAGATFFFCLPGRN
jgi:PAS domain S-box-containing protein